MHILLLRARSRVEHSRGLKMCLRVLQMELLICAPIEHA